MAITATLRRAPAATSGASPTPTPAANPAPAPANDATGGRDFVSEFADELDGKSAPAPESGPQPDPGVKEPGAAVAVRGSAEVTPHVPAMGENGAIAGEFDESDIKLPTLKIVNGSGELSKTFNQGTLLLGEDIIFDAPNPREPGKSPKLRFIPLRIQKRWRESLSQEEQEQGLMPRVVDTREEAEAISGKGCTEWVGGNKPRWSPTAVVVMLVETPPEGTPGNALPVFTEEIGGKFYSLAVFYVGGTAYGVFAKGLFNGMQFSCRIKGQIVPHRFVWEMTVVKKAAGQFTVFVPSPKLTRDVSPEGAAEYALRVNSDPRALEEARAAE